MHCFSEYTDYLRICSSSPAGGGAVICHHTCDNWSTPLDLMGYLSRSYSKHHNQNLEFLKDETRINLRARKTVSGIDIWSKDLSKEVKRTLNKPSCYLQPKIGAWKAHTVPHDCLRVDPMLLDPLLHNKPPPNKGVQNNSYFIMFMNSVGLGSR